MSDNNHIQDIMLRYLNGEATDEETTTLLEWIEESKANAAEFDLVKNLWSDSAEATLIDVNTDKAWQTVGMQTVEKEKKAMRLFSWKKTLAIAASIIVVIGVVFFFLQPDQTTWEITYARHSNKTIRLSDGTIISLRKGSKLSVPEDYEKAAHKVKLYGIAFFEVKHNIRKPFTVITPNSVIRDIGTAFIVRSYDSISQVTVLEGKVSFAGKKKKHTIKLHAGESAILKNDIPQRKVIDTANALSWKSKILIFNNTPLSQVAKDIENYYSIAVELPEELQSIQITAEFNNELLKQVVKELNLFTKLKFEQKDDTLFISK